MAEMDELSYASAGSKVVISEAPRMGAMYTCLSAGAFTGLAGMLVLLPPNKSQDDSNRTARHNRSGVKRLIYFIVPISFHKLLTNVLRLANAAARNATCTNPSMLVSARVVGQLIYSSPAACTICMVCP